MKRWFSEIISTTKQEQEDLRETLMIETRKRKMSALAGLEEKPPRKVQRVVPEMLRKIIDIMEEDLDEPTIANITLGMNPYLQ